jgi:hypothetical protein
MTNGSTTELQHGLGQANGRWLVSLILGAGLFITLSLVANTPSSWAGTGEASEHFSKYLEIPLEGDSIPQKLTFPLYQQNNIQYFSAGLGKEERSLSYPPYPLKLIFVKGKRAFLADVAIEVLGEDRNPLLSIPREEVQGPWLFLNLPDGKYVVQATDSGGTTLEKIVHITPNKMTRVHFLWP